MTTTSTTTTATSREFFKCRDCLTVFAIDLPRKSSRSYQDARCGACNGQTWWMGSVRRNTLVMTENRCACDERCTSATGPSCECACGGENHGIGALVEVVCGIAKIPAERIAPNALQIAEEYRAAVKAAQAALVALGWRNDWHRDQLRRPLVRAYGLRTHAPRMKLLRAIAANPANP